MAGDSRESRESRASRESRRSSASVKGALLLAIGAALAAAVAYLASIKGVATDLYSLAGDDGALLGALAQKAANEIRVLCTDEERAAKCRDVFPFREAPEADALLDFFAGHGGGLLTEKSRALLEAGEYDKIRRSVKRRDYTGIGLFPKASDPYYFLSDYVASLKALMPKGLADGQVLFTADASGRESELRKLIALAEDDDGIFLSGSPFHTHIATEKSKREINILGGISLVAILFIGLGLFRSPRFVLPTIATLSFGALVGATAVFAFFPRPHILTFLFGSTLIGLGVDYCYHSLAAGGRPPRRQLTAALLTTTLAFSPLLFSSVAVLNQMAFFTIAGLVAIWSIAVTGGTSVATRNLPLPRLRSKYWSWAIFFAYLAAIVALACGWRRLAATNDPSHFYMPPAILAKGEAKVAECIGGMSAFAVTSAPTLEEALQKEEAANIVGVSRILPSLKRQNENARLVNEFCAANGSSPPRSSSPITLDALPASLRSLADAMILEHDGMVHLLSHAGESAKQIAKISPRGELENMFMRFSRETSLLVCASFAMMAFALLCIFRRRFFEYATPVAMATMMTAGALGWLGEKITFFHILCFFVMTGIGIDYVIFNLSSARGRGGVVLASFLTSLVGFGALAFTSFPPTRAMGTTLAIGLFFAYIFSLQPSNRQTVKPSNWHEQKEKGATRLGILIIWHIYRLFGKTAAKFVFLVPLAFIAPFCRGVGWRKILAFAWSRIDIVDAVTLRKNPPRFTFSGDSEWRRGGAFLISSHLGSIEVLAALCDANTPHLHAFQQVTHDPVFTKFLTERMTGFSLHAVEEIGVETAVEMQDAIRAGSLVLMAGDRESAKGQGPRANVEHDFMEKARQWPRGVFKFAKLMESPVYAIIAVQTGWNEYEVKARRLGDDMLNDYVAFLENEVKKHPSQWFQF